MTGHELSASTTPTRADIYSQTPWPLDDIGVLRTIIVKVANWQLEHYQSKRRHDEGECSSVDWISPPSDKGKPGERGHAVDRRGTRGGLGGPRHWHSRGTRPVTADSSSRHAGRRAALPFPARPCEILIPLMLLFTQSLNFPGGTPFWALARYPSRPACV